jgi:two-component system, LuxR family, sensor kinase FixL
MLSPLLRGSRKSVLFRAGFLIAAIALIDWRLVNDLPLGFLYLLPMLMVGRVLRPWQIAGVAVLCTVVAENFDQFVWSLRAGMPRDVLYFVAFFCVGLFVYEVNRNRQVVIEHLHEIEEQRDARREAEEQLKVLIESSPAAIITADSDGCVLMANEAAHRMLAVGPATLSGRSIYRYFPSLSNISSRDTNQQLFRTVMQSRGQREDGEVFLADICFSTYRTDAGSRLAAMILDASEELRTQEEASLHQMLTGSRIAVGAVSHEIRNVCGAIAVVHQNLSRSELLAQNKDFEALGSLVLALERIAAVDLRQSSDQATEVDLIAVLDDLKIVITQALREEAIECAWMLEPDLPPVWADRTNLIQVFLNLITNSRRALSPKKDKMLSVSARSEGHRVLVEFIDNGGGVDRPEQLFHPFQAGAQQSGLGLYLSRAFMRSFGGELRYKALSGGACFMVELLQASQFETIP